MPFDFKKEYREFYLPSNQPEIVTVPAMRYVAVQGEGDPNVPGGAYQQAIGVLYAVAYTLKMSYKTDHAIPGFFQYVVPPLEGFWQQAGGGAVDYSRKDAFRWISAIRLPDFVGEADFAWAVETAAKKKKLDCSAAELLTVEEGLCVQMLHLGPVDGGQPRHSHRPMPPGQARGGLRHLGDFQKRTQQRLHGVRLLSFSKIRCKAQKGPRRPRWGRRVPSLVSLVREHVTRFSPVCQGEGRRGQNSGPALQAGPLSVSKKWRRPLF